LILDFSYRILRFDYFAATQAGRADADTPGRRTHFGVDRAQVDVPAPLGHVVSVADIVPELRPLAADITNMCHGLLQISSELDAQTVILTEFPGFDQPVCGAGALARRL
jgi:hypothetical protein